MESIMSIKEIFVLLVISSLMIPINQGKASRIQSPSWVTSKISSSQYLKLNITEVEVALDDCMTQNL